VHIGNHKDDPLNCSIALKIHNDRTFTKEEINDYALKELSYIHLMDHPNVIKQVSFPYFSEGSIIHPFIYVQKDLVSFIREKEIEITSDPGKHAHFANTTVLQIMKGLSYIHSCGFIHRDIKMSNILIDPYNHNNVYIADFGLIIYTGGRKLCLANPVQTHTYRAPEVSAESMNYDQSVDIWSLGVLYLELLRWRVNTENPICFTGYPDDYVSDNIVLRPPKKNPTDFIPENLRHNETEERVKSMLQFYPHDRITADAYLQYFGNGSNDRHGNWHSILQSSDIVIKRSFYKKSENRYQAIFWVTAYLVEYGCSDDYTMASHIMYSCMRMFDYYTDLKGFHYDEMNSSENGRSLIQKILSCCIGVQLKLRTEKYNVLYESIGQYGDTHTALELCEYEKTILSDIKFSCFISTPFDYFDCWELGYVNTDTKELYRSARLICLQTIHNIKNVTHSAREIALECIITAAKLFNHSPNTNDPIITVGLYDESKFNTEELADVYQNNPFVNKENDIDLQKILDYL